MDRLTDFMTRGRVLVDDALKNLLPGVETEPERLHSAIHWSVFAGGKRFRPILMLAAGDVLGIDERSILPVAAAVEMIHTYSLIHDDLPAMDDDDLRRGRATCHKQFDEATAILAGDVLQTLAFKTIAGHTTLSAEKRIELVSIIANAAGTPAGMVAGQQLDIDGEGKPLTTDELEKIHRGKTGALIKASCISAAVIAGSDKSIKNALAKYAEDIGLLFQITDDLLDIRQSTETLGKTAGKDASAGKATYPSIHGVEKSERLADDLVESAFVSLGKINKDTTLLRSIAGYIRQRTA